VDDKILEAGIRAFEAGTSREACPYSTPSKERELWLAGWDEARRVVEEEMEDSVCRLSDLQPRSGPRPDRNVPT
jgi:ribosome modulation factor